MARVRWGILGCGNIATSAIAPAIRWSDNGDLVAIGSRSLERARAKAEALGARTAYGSYEELVADPDVDAVYIGLPNALHATWAIAAANAKKHVLCDKSLALTVADAHAMKGAARANGVRLACGFMYRHHPQWTLVRSLLADGVIGAVRHVRAAFRATLANPEDHRWTQGGALFDVTCYPVDAARLVTGEEPCRAQAVGDVASDDALLEFPSGAVVEACCLISSARPSSTASARVSPAP
jgi:predicted dehydrogenase